MSRKDNPGEDEQAVADEWEAALAEQAEEETPDAGGGKSSASAKVSRAELESLKDEDDGDADESRNMDVILDIPVTLAMEIGRTRISIRNLLQLNQGSVVELDRLAGEPLDVLVNGTLIAHGEVVVVNDRFGIRLTDVISPSERVKKLR